MTKGIDVSHYQGDVDFKKVDADGYEFVIAKATEGSKQGSNIVDPNFEKNIEAANKAGLLTNAYHYFLGVSENDARAEADLCIENLKKVKLTGHVFLDVEDKSLNTNKDDLTRFVNAFFEQMAMNGYKKLGIYSSRSFFETRLNEKQLRGGLLKWIAAYNDKSAGIDCDIWQHASDGKVSGISGNCDLNIAYTDKMKKPVTHPYPGHLYKLQKPYMKDANVKLIQSRVGAKADSIFGPKTEAKVKVFQKNNGLQEDGIVGPKTWKKLFN